MPNIHCSRQPAGQLAGLFYPTCELGFVEFVVFVDVEVADFFLLGLAGWDRAQLGALEKRDLDVLREAMDAQEPAFALDAVQR